MSARYQNPQTSRWISSDPAGFDLLGPMEKDDKGKMQMRSGFSVVESVNWYSYVSGNPVKYQDPTGLTEESVFVFNHESDFELKPDLASYDEHAILPQINGEAHYNNYSTGASLEVTTGGAKVDGSFKAVSGSASIEAVTGVASIGLTDGRPNVELFGAMLEGEISGQLNLPFDSFIKVGGSGSLLSGGFRVDFSKGIDIKIGLGAIGVGLSLTFGKKSEGGLGVLDLTPKRKGR